MLTNNGWYLLSTDASMSWVDAEQLWGFGAILSNEPMATFSAYNIIYELSGQPIADGVALTQNNWKPTDISSNIDFMLSPYSGYWVKASKHPLETSTVFESSNNQFLSVYIDGQLSAESIDQIQYLSSIGTSNITAITIGDTVSNINYPFSYPNISEYKVNNTNTFYTIYPSSGGGLFNNTLSELVLYPSKGNSSVFTIPASVTSIGNYAFNDASNLSSITFEENSQLASIGQYAFSNVTISSITIPASVNSIGYAAFQNAISLSSVTFEAGSQLASIGIFAFFQATSLTSITIPASVTSIETYAFYSTTNLSSVTFEAGSQLASIGLSTFQDTALTSITIPTSVTTIGPDAFASSGLSTVYIENGQLGITSPATGVSFFGATVNTELPPGSQTIFTYSDSTTSESTDTNITSSSYSVPSGQSLVSVSIGINATSIGTRAFYNATSLSSVTFEAGSQLIIIGIAAFQIATDLTSITIPASVTSIEGDAFYDASSLSSVTFEAGSQLATIGNGAFSNILIPSITIPTTVTSIGNYAFNNSNLNTVYIENGQLGVSSPDQNVTFFGATVNTELPTSNS
jgi:hypothetical protein